MPPPVDFAARIEDLIDALLELLSFAQGLIRVFRGAVEQRDSQLVRVIGSFAVRLFTAINVKEDASNVLLGLSKRFRQAFPDFSVSEALIKLVGKSRSTVSSGEPALENPVPRGIESERGVRLVGGQAGATAFLRHSGLLVCLKCNECLVAPSWTRQMHHPSILCVGVVTIHGVHFGANNDLDVGFNVGRLR